MKRCKITNRIIIFFVITVVAIIFTSAAVFAEAEGDTGATYPSRYDPRDTGMVTSVKDQGKWGLCWDFSMISTSESVLMKTGLAGKDIQLSELHIAYLKHMIDNSGSSKHSFTECCMKGGSNAYIYKQLIERQMGPALESTVPWQEPTDDFTLSNETLSMQPFKLDKYFTAKVSSSQEDIDKIKYYVSNYGAMDVSIFYNPDAVETEEGFKYAGSATADGNLYYKSKVEYANHGVSLVGWDDNYPGSNFIVSPPGDGAWLIKNSYGSGNEKVGSGYIWVSYYDSSIQNISATTPVYSLNASQPVKATITNKDSIESTIFYPGESFKITAEALPAGRNVTFKTDAKSLTLNQDGNTCNVEVGNVLDDKTYTIECIADGQNGDDYTDSVIINVKKLPAIKFGNAGYTNDKYYGDSFNLDAAYSDQNKYKTSYQSSNPDVATVDKNGQVTCVGYGEAKITATCTDDRFSYLAAGTITRSATVKVYAKSITTNYSQGITDEIPYDSDGAGPYKITTYLDNGATVTSSSALEYRAEGSMKVDQGVVSRVPAGASKLTIIYTGEEVKPGSELETEINFNITRQAKPVAPVTPVEQTYTIRYVSNSYIDRNLNPTTYKTSTETIVLRNPTRKGYSFGGWYSDSSFSRGVTRIVKGESGDKTLYAKWVKVTVAKAKTPTLKTSRGGKLKVSYKATPGAKGYQIQYATSKNFKKATTKTTGAKSKTMTLKKGKKYYVRVRAYKVDSTGNKVYGSWSSSKSIKVKK